MTDERGPAEQAYLDSVRLAFFVVSVDDDGAPDCWVAHACAPGILTISARPSKREAAEAAIAQGLEAASQYGAASDG